jgi:thiamine pyridinylase
MNARGMLTTLSCITLAASACVGPGRREAVFPGPQPQTAGGKVELRVSLYPWVPEPDSLMRWIEQDFERMNPEIDLVVRGADRSQDWLRTRYRGDLAYEIERTVAALTTHSDDVQHLVEIDAMILGALARHGAIVPFQVTGREFLPFAVEAVTWGDTLYGVPHWTCGYFVISENAAVRNARTVDELAQVLAAQNTPRPDLLGDLDGSWDAVMVYLDAYRDTYPDSSLVDAVQREGLDTAVTASLRTVGGACSSATGSLCGTDSVPLFSRGQVDALVGYSERLNRIFNDPHRTVGTLHLASAPLGAGDRPTLFTDALVMSPQCSSGACRRAARIFAEYYTSDRVFEVLMMARDVGPAAPPRYLLPSTSTAFRTPAVAADSLYQQLWAEIAGARPFPNDGVPEARARGAIRAAVRQALGVPSS